MDTIKKWAEFLFMWGIMYPIMLTMTEIDSNYTINPPDPYKIYDNWGHWVKVFIFFVLMLILYSVWP